MWALLCLCLYGHLASTGHAQPSKAWASAAGRTFEKEVLKRALAVKPTDASVYQLGNTRGHGADLSSAAVEAEPIVDKCQLISLDRLVYKKLIPRSENFSALHTRHPSWPVLLRRRNGTSCSLAAPPVPDAGTGGGRARVTLDVSANNAFFPKCEVFQERNVSWKTERLRRCLTTRSMPLDMQEIWRRNKSMPYRVLVPSACAAAGSGCPLVVFLHGTGGGTVRDLALCWGCAASMGVVALLPKLPNPNAPTNRWSHLRALWGLELAVGGTLAEFGHILDTRRVYLFGQSNGGGGALSAAFKRPDMFTRAFAIAPVDFMHRNYSKDLLLAELADSWRQLGMSATTRKLKSVHVFIGMKDEQVTDFETLHKFVSETGVLQTPVQVDLVFYPTLGHASWVAAFDELYRFVWSPDQRESLAVAAEAFGASASEREEEELAASAFVVAPLVGAALARLVWLWWMARSSSTRIACASTRSWRKKPEAAAGRAGEGEVKALGRAHAKQPPGDDEEASLLAAAGRAAEGEVEAIGRGHAEQPLGDEEEASPLAAAGRAAEGEVKAIGRGHAEQPPGDDEEASLLGEPRVARDAQRAQDRRSVEDPGSLIEALPRGEAPALRGVDPEGVALSHDKLRAFIESVADLSRRGVPRGATVAVVAGNGPELALALLSCLCQGVAVPLSIAAREEELTSAMEQMQVRHAILLTSEAGKAEDNDHVVAACRHVGCLLHVARGTPGEAAGWFTWLTDGDPPQSRGELSPPAFPRWSCSKDVALLLRTSGTTARPKIVPVTGRSLHAGAVLIGQSLALTDADLCLNVLPYYYVGGIVCNLLAPLLAGGGVICASKFEVTSFCRWLEILRPTWYYVVPTIHRLVLLHCKQAGVPRHSLRFVRSAAANLPHADARELQALLGCSVYPTYGMTECMPIASPPVGYRLERPGTVGQPLGTEVMIAGETGNALPYGETGEICVQGDLVCPGYLHGDAGQDFFLDGTERRWFRTGDRGQLDRDGFLFVTARAREMIKRGGEQVSPFTVEDVLLQHPAIGTCVVFGVPNRLLGEEVAAAVVLKPGQTPSQWGDQSRELVNFAAARLPSRMVPGQVKILSSEGMLPKTATGKMIRDGLHARLCIRPVEPEMPQRQENQDSDDGQVLVSDSLGLLRERSVRRQSAADALVGVAMLCLICAHWVPYDVDTTFYGPRWLASILLTVKCSHLATTLTALALGYVRGSDHVFDWPWSVCALMLYLVMGWPLLFPEHGAGVALYHRWSVLAFVLVRSFRYLAVRLAVPDWLQMVVALAGWAFSAMLSVATTSGPAQDAQVVTRPGRGFELYACYICGQAIVPAVLRRARRVEARLSMDVRWVRGLYGSLAFAILALQFCLDTPYAKGPGGSVVDWPLPKSMARAMLLWTARAAAEFSVLLLSAASADGLAGEVSGFSCALPVLLVGRSMLGVYISHAYVRPDFPALIEGFRPLGGAAQLSVALLVPWSYALTVGFATQWLLTRPIVWLGRLFRSMT